MSDVAAARGEHPGNDGSSGARYDQLVLVLAPAGRDGPMICERLRQEAIFCQVCHGMPELLSSLEGGVGAVVLTQEALGAGDEQALLRTIDEQPPWSDLPLVLLGPSRSDRLPSVPEELLLKGNVVLLPRPLSVRELLVAVKSALRARRRQYELRERVSELERTVRFNETLVGILGHDLRTPLSAIKMGAELIVRTSREERTLRPASRIVSASDRISRMIEQLLDYTRVRRGRGLPVHPQPTDLGALVKAAVQEVEAAAPAAKIELSEQGDLHGSWDPDRLAQLLSNLLTNAVRHGSGDTVKLGLDGLKQDVVSLSVSNAGVVPRDLLPVLFEPFRGEQAAAGQGTSRPDSQGLGLGLYIARQTARAHGGEIRVDSSEQEGTTTFTVDLPRHPV